VVTLGKRFTSVFVILQKIKMKTQVNKERWKEVIIEIMKKMLAMSKLNNNKVVVVLPMGIWRMYTKIWRNKG